MADGPSGGWVPPVAKGLSEADIQVAAPTEDRRLPEIASRFTQWQVNRLLMTDAQGRLVGIVARWNRCNPFYPSSPACHTGLVSEADLALLIGSFGASAVLVFGAVHSPLGQPRNLVGGHVVSAVVGVACYQWLGGIPLLAISAAVATAITAVHATPTLRPPGAPPP